METIAQEAKRLLSAVPAEDFIAEEFTDYNGKCCVIGHYMRLKSSDAQDFSMDNCDDVTARSEGTGIYFSKLREASRRFVRTKQGEGIRNIVDINNESSNEERKQNVMAHIDEMIAAGY